MFQDFRLVRHLSAFDNVALPLRVGGAGDEEVEGPVREMLAWVGLADRASARPPTLSGGEQQRVAIARAVINRPELLVADEPTGNVDAEMANRLMGLFTAINRLGTTVVVATHDVGLINATPGAQLIRLENGTLVDPDRYAQEPAATAAERQLMFDWLFVAPSERRLLGAARFGGPTPWVIAIMTFSIMLIAATGLALASTARRQSLDRIALWAGGAGRWREPRRAGAVGALDPRRDLGSSRLRERYAQDARALAWAGRGECRAARPRIDRFRRRALADLSRSRNKPRRSLRARGSSPTATALARCFIRCGCCNGLLSASCCS